MNEPYEWRAIGGHLALDLANTVSWRLDLDRRVDRLGSAEAVVDWAAALGVVGAGQAGPLRREVASAPGRARTLMSEVVDLRAAVTAAMDAVVDGRVPEARVVRDVRRAWQGALAIAEVDPALPLRWVVRPSSLANLAHLLGLAAGDLLRSADVATVGRCNGEGCGWLFLDTTRNHSRRWCDTADCGNRARGRRHRAKLAQRAAD